MAYTLTTSDLSHLQRAIDLLERGTAPQLTPATGIHESIVQELSQVAKKSGFSTDGKFYEAIKNNPISTLLSFMRFLGINDSGIYDAIQLMVKTDAEELPFDAGVIEKVAKAGGGGFATEGLFREALRDRPISTLLKRMIFIQYHVYSQNSDDSLIVS